MEERECDEEGKEHEQGVPAVLLWRILPHYLRFEEDGLDSAETVVVDGCHGGGYSGDG